MTSNAPTPVAIVGCGNIATQYADTFIDSPDVTLIGAFDLDADLTKAFANEYDCIAFASLSDLLASDAEIVVNLTIHHAHFDVTSRIIDAGKHVYSEKPLALTSEEAHRLVELADDAGVHLACSPFTWLGPSQQRVFDDIRRDRLGTVRAIYAEVNHGRIETWHPNPEPFYDVGVVWDVGVYPLALLTAFFGPVTSVTSTARLLLAERSTVDGSRYTFTAPDLVVSVLDLEDGPTVRLTASFYVTNATQSQGIEFHGDIASIRLGSWADPIAQIEFAEFGEPYIEEVPPPEVAWDVSWGFGVEDMAKRLRTGVGPRTTGAHAAHVVDIIEAIEASIESGSEVVVTSTFERPD